MAAAFLLESLQAFTPDRTANLVAALCGVGEVLAAAFVAELFIRAWRWRVKGARSVPSGHILWGGGGAGGGSGC